MSLQGFGVRNLFNAVRAGRLNQVEGKAEIGVDLDSVNDWGRTPMHIAAIQHNPAIVKSLLDQGASSFLKDRDGRRPIHFASEGFTPQDAEIVQMLCPIGQNKEAKLYGKTPLLIAAERAVPEIVDTLLKCGANVTAKTREGRTVLDIVGTSAFPGPHRAEQIERTRNLLQRAVEKRGLVEMMVGARKGPSTWTNWALQTVGLQEKNQPLAIKYGVPPEMTGEISKFFRGGKRKQTRRQRHRRRNARTQRRRFARTQRGR